MNKAISAILPAAGSGTRMGGRLRKTHLPLAGKPILVHTIDVFENSTLVDSIVVVVAESDLEPWKCLIRELGFLKVAAVIAGGKTRQQSVYRGLRRVPEAALVVIHDGVRPLVNERMIENCIAKASEYGAATAAVRVKDTIKRADASGKVEETLVRDRLWAIQTPQAFDRELLLRAHEAALTRGFEATDDAALVEALGHPVVLAEGDYRNLKITTPEDLVIAEALLRRSRMDSSSLGEPEGSRL